MPDKPEFIPTPEFIRLHCANTGDACTVCPKDFVIQLGAIEAILKTQSGKAAVIIRTTHYMPTPFCGRKLQTIVSAISFEDVLAVLDGKIFDLGNISMDDSYSIQVN